MNRIYPRSGRPGIPPAKLPKLLAIAIILLVGIQGSIVHAQEDSLKISPIPLSEIATTAATDLQNTRDLLVQRIQVPTSSKLVPLVDSLEIRVSVLTELSDQILRSHMEYSFYNSLILRWERIDSRIDPMSDVLKKYSADVEGIRTELETFRTRWDVTLLETDPTLLTEDIISRINGIDQYIDSAQQILGDSLNSSIALQNRVSDLDLVIGTYLQKITELQKVELGKSLLSKDRLIFNIDKSVDSLYVEGDKTLFLTMGIEDSRVYLGNEWPTLVLLLVSFLGLLIAFIFLRRAHLSTDPGDDPDEWNRIKVVSNPLATAFIFTMLLALWWLPARPAFLREIFAILFVISFFPLFQAIIFRALRYSLYYLFAILLFNILNDYLQLGEVYMRLSSLLESIALFSFHVYFLIAKKRLTSETTQGRFFYQLLNTVQPFYFLLTLSAIIANLIGYRNYTDLVNEGVLLSMILLLLFATGFFSLTSAIHLFFKTKAADKSLLIKENKDRIYKWLFRNLRVGTVFLWAIFTLKFFFLLSPLTEGLKKVLDLGYEFGSLTMTIRDILSFILVVYLSWLISFIIRNLLEVELFGRLKLPRGVPKAVSSLTQYFLISLGFMLALSAAGFSMQNLSLMAGALGVGIGFGLQNIVNNFISGLILAFERPVTVGDIINVAGHEGEVQKIGIRASVIKQYDGSEVIVPNADLISGKVVNWTLTKYTRRMIMTVHTHQDTDTDLVLKTMKEAAYKVKLVLKKPEVKSYFHGIKDKQLEFALYYWASGNILDCKSLVNQEVQKALTGAGIEFVMPLHVIMRNDEQTN